MLATISRRLPGIPALCRMTSPVLQRWSSQNAPEKQPGDIVLHKLEGQERAHMMTVQNGRKAEPTFSATEMNNRITKLRKYMAENDIEGALFTSYQNINYYSDFMYCSFGRPYGLAVTQDTATTISAFVDWAQPWRRANTCDNLIYTDWQLDNFWRAVEKELGHVRGKVGFETGHMTVASAPKMQKAVANAAEMVDIGKPVMQLRLVKSPEEIKVIKACTAVADLGVLAQFEAMKEGATEYEIAMHGTQAMVRHIGQEFPGVELRDTYVWFQTGPNTDGRHNPPSYDILRKGVISSINSSPQISGYYVALKRTTFLDHVPDASLRLWEINCKVLRRGIELIKPGAHCKDIIKELNEIYRSHDLLDCSDQGFSLYGAKAFREDNETVLEPNMIVSMEPMIVIQEGVSGAGGYRERDSILVTESGNDALTSHAFGPEHFVIKKYLLSFF